MKLNTKSISRDNTEDEETLKWCGVKINDHLCYCHTIMIELLFIWHLGLV